MRALEIIRTFETKQFRVVVAAEEEPDLDLSWDETGETARGIDNGTCVAFCAHAYVVHKLTGIKLADDYLGNCVYESFNAFMDHKECGAQNREYEARGISGRCGSYFASMVKTVCSAAREQLEVLKEQLAETRIRA